MSTNFSDFGLNKNVLSELRSRYKAIACVQPSPLPLEKNPGSCAGSAHIVAPSSVMAGGLIITSRRRHFFLCQNEVKDH